MFSSNLKNVRLQKRLPAGTFEIMTLILTLLLRLTRLSR